ncbi:uncharacterized protein LOC125560693 isoform X2 [Nematostella vectensis]|uniref:uncharacterized protein LOC125560693 isoform X2 n=1 Tax=Nematostella vectensis TaxID=45351 RepID=UPI0020776C88|nr:uncharacterized protein LOC125560693 isoform X2 [Nematostella vectensis]
MPKRSRLSGGDEFSRQQQIDRLRQATRGGEEASPSAPRGKRGRQAPTSHPTDPTTSHPTDPTGFSEAQLSVIRKTVSDALASWRPPQQDIPSPPVVASEGTPGSASPLVLDRPLDEALEGKITRAPSIAPKTALLVNTASPHTAHRAFLVTTCASTSTESPAVPVKPASTLTFAKNAPTPIPLTSVAPESPHPQASAKATEAKLRVAQLHSKRKATISTPIKIDLLEQELSSHPDREFVTSLLNSLRFGARIGFDGTQKSRVSPNLISARVHPEIISKNIEKEVNLGRMAGPFSAPPLPNFQCHPVGVVPKKHSADWRTIYHLSFPEGDSINDGIPKDPYSLQYVRVDDAISILTSLGKGAFMAKTDLKSAFRLIPIHPNDWNLLGVRWESRYYVDLYLPFGLRSAPFLFNQLSEALEWVLKHNYNVRNVIHILDDFFVAESSKLGCLESFTRLLKFFISVGAPVVASKTIGPSTTLEFMGIELDTLRMEARLPSDKLERLKASLRDFKRKRSARLIELQSLIGTLQFACRVVVPGRTFLQRIIDLTRRVNHRFHHVKLSHGFFQDLAIWQQFTENWNGKAFFLEEAIRTSPDMELYSDASGSIGFGGYFSGRWFQGRWPPHLAISKKTGISIEWQELFPIVVACSLWCSEFSGKRIQFWCDNQSVVHIVNTDGTIQRARTGRGPDPLCHPAFANDPLTREVKHYADKALAINTKRTYHAGEKQFIDFCLMNRLFDSHGDILPASESTLIYFVTFLARRVKHGTIRTYLAAVRNMHIENGFQDPIQGRLILNKVLRGILRVQGQHKTARQPVTPQLLKAIRPVLLSWLSAHDFHMIWAAFTLAFFGFLRCSEFTCPGVRNFDIVYNLSPVDINFHPNPSAPLYMKVVIKASKTDPFRQGTVLTIARSGCDLCAVSAMQEFVRICGYTTGPLFRFRSGKYLTRSLVSSILRDAARACGLPHSSLKGHSFRIGAASCAAAAGLPDWLIKVLGRWSSDCYQLYVRTPQNILLTAAPKMAIVQPVTLT